MHVLSLLIGIKLKAFAAIFFDKKRNALIRNSSTAVVLVIMMYASYLFFNKLVFSYVAKVEEIGFLLIDRLVSVGFMAFFFMLIISSFAVTLAMFIRSSETEYLFSTPVHELIVFSGKYIDIIIYSSWAILVMALPILYSYAKIRAFGAFEYVMIGFLVFFPFILISTSLGTLLALLALKASKHIRLNKLIFIFIILFAGFVYIVVHFLQPNKLVIHFTEDFRALNLFINNFRLNSHPFTPNFWLIQCLRAVVLHEYREFLLYASALLSTALFSLMLLYTCADLLFFRTWLSSNEQSMTKDKSERRIVRSRTGFLSKPTSSQIRALVNKDVLIFIREPGQWAQMFLILALMALYFISLYFIPDDIEIEQWRTIISIMNFGFCGFVLATLAVRFVYPSISLEGGSFWVLGSAPLSVATLFREKFLISFAVFFVITELIALISGAILKLEGLYQLLTISGICLMSIALSSLAIGFGAAFPDFSERNPSRIASGPGGILTIVLSLFYIGIMMALLAVPCYKYTVYLTMGGNYPSRSIFISAVSAIILNVVVITVPLVIGAKALARREFT